MPKKRSSRPIPPPPGVGMRLRERRKAADLTQRQLADGRFSASYVSGVELGKVMPSLRFLQWCGSQLQASVSDLLGDDAALFDRRQRQRFAEAGYEQAYAEMLLSAGEVSEAGKRLRALHKRLGANTSKPVLWLAAYIAQLEGDLEGARADLKAYGSAPPTGDSPLDVAAHHWLRGLIASAEGALTPAVDEHRQALATGAESFIAPDFAIGVRASLAETYLRARQFEQAYETQSEALRLYERLSNPLSHAAEARRLAEEAAKAYDFLRAHRLIRWADTMYREARTMLLVFQMCLRHAFPTASVAAQQAPQRDLELAMSIAQRLDDDAKCRLVSALLVLVHLEQGDTQQATRYASEGLSGNGAVNERLAPVERAIVALAHGALAHAQGRDDSAHMELKRADAALREAGDVSEADLGLALFGYKAAVRLADALLAEQMSRQLMRRDMKLRRTHGL